ncbi:MAG: hypothetical protein EOM46_17060 [Gammaproteobacteria bacterium]|nr:hypothetical protein [Gammaproteobacteria bacterium]
MPFQINAILSQGIGLPNESQTATVLNVATLSKWQQGWRIKHPQAVLTNGQLVSHSPITGTLPVIYPYLGAWIGSQRKRPHCAFPLVGTALRLPDPPLAKNDQWTLQMIYTFLITANRGRIVDVQRIRTISAFAKSETEARQRLAGLPLIFVSRSPAQEVAA